MQKLSITRLSLVAVILSYSARHVVARPQSTVGAATPIPILYDERIPVDAFGGYGFTIQTANGINWRESAGAVGPQNVIRHGEYSFTHPDGTVHQMRYTADAGGFKPESNMLPTPFPLEPWQLEQVRFAEEQRRLQAVSGQASF